MEEARCRVLFLALFTPMLTIEGNVPRLRARSAHFVSHLPTVQATGNLLVNALKVRRNRPQRSNFAFKVRLRAGGQLPNERCFRVYLAGGDGNSLDRVL